MTSVNCIPICPKSRQVLANIALGSKAIQESQFYSSLHENNQVNSSTVVPSQDLKFDSSAWDLIRGQAPSEDNQKTFNETEEEINLLKELKRYWQI